MAVRVSPVQISQQLGGKEHCKVTLCNKPHTRDLLGRDTERWLLQTRRRDSRGLGAGVGAGHRMVATSDREGGGFYRGFGPVHRELVGKCNKANIVWP